MSAENNVYDLDYCVNSVLADVGEPESKNYMRYLKFANDAFRRLGLANLMPTTVSTAVLPVDQHTNTCKLPQDYVTYYKLGVCKNMGNGYSVFVNFDIADSLCIRDNGITACKCSDEEIGNAINQCCNGNNNAVNGYGDTSWYYPYYSHWHNGQFMAGYYGRGAGFSHGGYRIDEKQGIIQLATCIHIDEVILEYESSGLSGEGNAIIPQTAIPAITAFIHMQRCALSREPMVNRMTSYWSNKFRIEASAMAKRQNALSRHEWMQLFRLFTYQTPKR